MTRLLRLRSRLSVVAAMFVVCAAQTAGAQDLAAAEALFREGRTLVEQGHVAEGCGKLAESQRLDPSSGTLINLADCHAKLGKVASAWAEFLAAERLATRQGKLDRADEARRRAEQIAPSLSYLTVVVKNPVPGVKIQRDDVVLEATSLGSRIPTDPGHHELAVSAPGYASITLQVEIGAAGDSQTVVVPALVKQAEKPPVNGSEQRPAEAANSGKKTLGFVVLGAGAAVLVTGATFGVLALTTYGNAEDLCPAHTDCSAAAKDRYDTANTFANVANVGVPLGLIGVGVGTALVLTAKGAPPGPATSSSSSHRGARLVPVIGPRSGGLSFSGAF